MQLGLDKVPGPVPLHYVITVGPIREGTGCGCRLEVARMYIQRL